MVLGRNMAAAVLGLASLLGSAPHHGMQSFPLTPPPSTHVNPKTAMMACPPEVEGKWVFVQE